LFVAGLVTLAAGVSAHWLPEALSANGVGLLFFGATYWLVLRRDPDQIARHGLSFGGLFEPVPLVPRRMLRETAFALLWATAAAAILLPPFAMAYHYWWQPSKGFEFTPGSAPFSEMVTHVVAVALPEEMFYRGYLQTELRQKWPSRHTGAFRDWDLALLVTSAVFALGHVVTIPHPARLAVFFPSLIFGWLRYRTGGIGASVLFHASCNVFALNLGRGYGFFS
jgi:membrane protease YdiL (CAAX protease family)